MISSDRLESPIAGNRLLPAAVAFVFSENEAASDRIMKRLFPRSHSGADAIGGEVQDTDGRNADPEVPAEIAASRAPKGNSSSIRIRNNKTEEFFAERSLPGRAIEQRKIKPSADDEKKDD
jgi:hypothetical protein